MRLTVFTPTYNRAYALPRLYKSLTEQTDKRFEWLVVDDGSTDETKRFIDDCINEGKIDIRYSYQENKGKMMAHNLGVELTQTELFTCVDSDDFLSEGCVEKVLNAAKGLESEIGILAFKYDVAGKKGVTKVNNNVKAFTLKDGYDLYGLKGDTMLIYKTEVIKKYGFPHFEGEKFVPEAYLYDLLDDEGKLLILRENLYMCEYLSDGYTASMARVLYNNPNGYFLYITNRIKKDKGFKSKFLDTVRYNAMAKAHKKQNYIKKAVFPLLAFLAYIPGYILYLKKYKPFVKE